MGFSPSEFEYVPNERLFPSMDANVGVTHASPLPVIISPINKIEWLWDLRGGSKPPPYEVNLTERNKSPPYGWARVPAKQGISPSAFEYVPK